jgi:hypothetical protein
LEPAAVEPGVVAAATLEDAGASVDDVVAELPQPTSNTAAKPRAAPAVARRRRVMVT